MNARPTLDLSISEGHAPTAVVNCDQSVVIVVDDDDLMRSVLRRVLASAGLTVELYASGKDLFEHARLDRPGCIILDVSMPEMGGLEVQACLKRRHVDLAVIFLTGSSDIPIAVTAIREGAVDFIEKPFDSEHLIARVRHAINGCRCRRQGDAERLDVLRRLSLLTPRECSVLELVVTGKTSKEIARTQGTSHRTVEIHRRNLMEKLAAPTLADLVRMQLLASSFHAEHQAATSA
jgi:two-component system response regulator FixJ